MFNMISTIFLHNFHAFEQTISQSFIRLAEPNSGDLYQLTEYQLPILQ